MTPAELTAFLDSNTHVQCIDDEANERLLFNNMRLQWYKNGGATAISYAVLDTLDADGLMKAINRGLEVEQITRITGYMTKVSSWNPGKRAELKDRAKWTIGLPETVNQPLAAAG